MDSSRHEKELQEFRTTKAKFRQTRRQNAIQSDPFKLLEKQQPKHNHHHHNYTKREDPSD